jgi:WXG100 family type VII secretion target
VFALVVGMEGRLASDRIYADLGVLERGAQNFEHVLKEFEEVLDGLDDHLRVSLADWTGDARRAYQVFHEAWRKDARELAVRLAHLRQVIANSHGNYTRSHHANIGMWNP